MSVGCPVCGREEASVADLAGHLVDEAGASDVRHVMWLNRNVTKHRVDTAALVPLLERYLAGGSPTGDRVAR